MAKEIKKTIRVPEILDEHIKKIADELNTSENDIIKFALWKLFKE